MTEERHPAPGEVWRRTDYPKLTCRIDSVDDEKVTVTILTNDMGNPHLAPTNRSMNPDGLMSWSGPMGSVTDTTSLHARELGGTCLPGFLDRWVRMSDEHTLFGKPVGDGLDREREDARLAISILRKLMNEGDVILDTYGPGKPERAGDPILCLDYSWFDVTSAEARLLEELSE